MKFEYEVEECSLNEFYPYPMSCRGEDGWELMLIEPISRRSYEDQYGTHIDVTVKAIWKRIVPDKPG